MSQNETSIKLLIVHLSDIHIREDRERNHIISRSKEIAQCINSAALQEECCHIIFGVTGDIAYSGLTDEYRIASAFFESIAANTEQSLSWVMTPGNHDCNFTGEGAVRRSLIASETELEVDPELERAMLNVQQGYENFSSKFVCGVKKPILGSKTVTVRDITVRSKIVRTVAVNTSWVSRKNEQYGAIWLPGAVLESPADQMRQGADLVIALAHHPENWFSSATRRQYRKWLTSCSDMALLGHEHDSDTHKRTGLSYDDVVVSDGGALQGHRAGSSHSTFKILIAEIETDGKLNVRASEAKWHPSELIYKRHKSGQRFGLSPKLTKGPKLHPSFIQELESLDAPITHPEKPQLQLNDIYVDPDIRPISVFKEASDDLIRNCDDFATWVISNERCLVLGDEFSGKTALARRTYSSLLRGGFSPLLLKCIAFDDLTKDCAATLKVAYDAQYRGAAFDDYAGLPKIDRVVIVDEFNPANYSSERLSHAISLLEKWFSSILLIGSHSAEIEKYLEVGRDGFLLRYKTAHIMSFGHKKRSELVGKWCSLGSGRTNNESEWQRLLVGFEKKISDALGKDLIPPSPGYILAMLQMVEAGSTTSTQHSGSTGYIYEALIVSSLNRIGIDRQIIHAHMTNYLPCLACRMSQEGLERLSEQEVKAWHKDHCDAYLLDWSYTKTMRELTNARILVICEGHVSFSYRYHRYLFMAKWIARFISRDPRDEALSALQGLTRRIHEEESANIILFLSCFSSDEQIVSHLVDAAAAYYTAVGRYDFRKGVSQPLTHTSPLRLPDGSAEDRRQTHLEAADRREMSARSGRDADGGAHGKSANREDGESENDDIYQETVRISAAIKTVRVLGKLLREFSGSLTAEDKHRISEACHGCTLRLLEFMRIMCGEMVTEFVGAFAAEQKRKSPDSKVPDRAYEEQAERWLQSMFEMMCVSMVRLVSDAFGNRELLPLLESILENEESGSARQLLAVAAEIEIGEAFPENKVTALWKHLSKDGAYVAMGVLRYVVWHHFYLYERDMKVRQRVCNLLGISTSPPKLNSVPQGQKRALGSGLQSRRGR